MRPPSRRPTTAALVIVATLGAACGGATSSSTTTRPSATPRPHAGAAVADTPPTTARAGTTAGRVTATQSGPGSASGSGSHAVAKTGGTSVPTTASADTTPGAASTTPGGSTSPTTDPTGGGTGPTGTLPVIAATSDGGFLSPDHQVACLLAIDPSDQVRCVSFPSSTLVVMTPDGSLTRCTGSTCALGSRDPGYKVLASGTATGTDAFRCASTAAGITCTVPSGSGFTVSGSGLRSLG